MEITIFNHSKYDSYASSVKDVEVVVDGQSYRYQTIAELLHEESNIVSQITELKRAQEEKRKALEAAEEECQREAAEKAEKARLQAEEIKRKALEEQKQINELENKLAESQEKKARALSFIREGMQMRVQHILDASQENAKRSHLYDGVPIVIEGGPGTGKTTTMIQRLKFLISEIALREYEAPLTDEQIEEVTNPQNRNKKWLYFSPTDKLLGYLRDNMTAEELVADEDNSTTLEAFSKKMLGAYGLKIPGTEGPFKWYKNKEGEESMITDATVAIVAFERFLVKKISSSMMAAAKMSTSGYSWHALALGIKAYCQKAENVKDIVGLMPSAGSLMRTRLTLHGSDPTHGRCTPAGRSLVTERGRGLRSAPTTATGISRVRSSPTQKWMFYTASSEYFIGDFDGFQFTNYSVGKRASYTDLAYAGQTYNNAPDRIILIQWLRTQNPNRLYTGMMTLPREIELLELDGEWILAQHPVHEWFDAKKAANTLFQADNTTACQAELTSPAAVGIDLSLGSASKVSFSILGNDCSYDTATGIFTCAEATTQLPAGLTKLHLIADRGILELSARQDTVVSYWELPDDRTCADSSISAMAAEGSGCSNAIFR